MFEIPLTFDASKSLTRDDVTRIMSRDQIFFSPKLDERIEVTSWFRYPSYDFIFGLPTGKRAEKEVACMWVRYTKGKQYCVYFDRQELGDAIEALLNLKAISDERDLVDGKK